MAPLKDWISLPSSQIQFSVSLEWEDSLAPEGGTELDRGRGRKELSETGLTVKLVSEEVPRGGVGRLQTRGSSKSVLERPERRFGFSSPLRKEVELENGLLRFLGIALIEN